MPCLRHSIIAWLRRLTNAAAACFLLVSASGSIASSPNTGSPIVLSKSFWIEATGTADLSKVLDTADWQPYRGAKTFGFGPEAIWVKIRLRGAMPHDQPDWLIRVAPPFMDNVTIFDPAMGERMRAGRGIPIDEGAIAALTLSFPVKALPQERDVFLRMTSVSTRVLRIEVLPFADAERAGRLEELTLAAAVVVSFVFALLAGLQWLTSQERVIGTFAVKQLIACMQAFVMLGFARLVVGPYLPAGVLTELGSALGSWLAASTIWFIATLLTPYGASKKGLLLLKVFAVTYLVLPLTQLAGLTREMLIVINSSIPFGVIALLLTAATALKRKTDQPIPITWVFVYLCFYSFLHMTSNLIHLGVVESSISILVGSVMTAIADGIVMFLLLQFRARAIQKSRQEALVALAHSHEKTEAARRQREEQAQLFAMLAHEMKTPLATLQLLVRSKVAQRDNIDHAISDMNSIIERCVQAGQIADQGLSPVHQNLDALELTRTCVFTCREPHRVSIDSQVQSAPVLVDAQFVSIVLSNLLDNACKYSSPDSLIKLKFEESSRMGRQGWAWQFDSLSGISGLPDPQRLFEKYYRSPKAKRQSGSGLGLFLVKQLMEVMGGTVCYRTESEHAIFEIWLPAEPDPR